MIILHPDGVPVGESLPATRIRPRWGRVSQFFKIQGSQFSSRRHVFSSRCHVLYDFKVGISIIRIEEFIDPEDGVEIIVANVGDVVGVPYGHVNIGRFIA